MLKKLSIFTVIIISLLASVYYLSYPSELMGRYLVLSNRQSFDKFESLMISHKELAGVTCNPIAALTPNPVVFSPFRDESKIHDLSVEFHLDEKVESEFFDLCRDLNKPAVWRKPSFVFCYYGGDGDKPYYWLGVKKHNQGKKFSLCPRFSTIDLNTACLILIDDTWALEYTRVE